MANTVPPIPPALTGSAATNSAAASTIPALTVANPPPGLSQVALGTAIQGTVFTAESTGAFGIQTPVGTLNVLSNLALPNNAVLTLLLQSLSPQARLLITAINGQPPGQALQTQQGPAPSTVLPGTVAPTATVSVGTAPVITALVLPNAASRTPSGGTPQTANTGSFQGAVQGASQGITQATPSSALGTALGTATPATNIGSPNTPGTPPSSTRGGALNATQAGNAPSGLQSAQPAGTQIPVRIIGIQPAVPGATTPALPALSSTPLSAGQTLTGIVTGTTPGGQATGYTVVQTPAGTLSVPITESAPQGSSVTFEIAGKPLLPAMPSSSPALPLDLFSLSREWPALKEALQALQESHPNIAQQLINMIIPRLDTQLASNLLIFIIGLRGGDIRNWLGEEPMRALENSRPDLARQLRTEFGQLSRAAEEKSSNDWRHMLIPLNTGDAIEPIHMFMRQRKKKDDDTGDTETRFVIDVGLSQLSRIQLDGLIGEHNKRLDLIVRSHNPLPGLMQNDIRTIYINAGEITGMTGGLNFQAAPPNFVELQAPATPDGGAGIIA